MARSKARKHKDNFWNWLKTCSTQEIRRFLARHSIKFFAQEYLGIQLYDHHLRWLARPCDYHNVPRFLIEAPKDHGKSWSIGYIYPLWRIVTDLNIRVIYVSDTATQAKMHIRPIIYQLETNRKLIDDFAIADKFGEKGFRPDYRLEQKWTESEIIVNRPNKVSEHPTLLAVGCGGAVLGRRSDLIVGDDMLDKDNSEKPEQREKVKYWHDNELLNTLVKTGQEVVIGTPQNEMDLYSDLMERKAFAGNVIVDKAIINAGAKKVLWDSQWPYERLMERKEEIGTIYFNMNYQCEPISDETSWFKRNWLTDRCYDSEAALVETNSGLEDWGIVMGVDLAIGDQMDDSYFVIFVLGLDELQNHWLLHLYRAKGLTFNAQLNHIAEVSNNFDPVVCFVEDNAYQKAMAQELARRTDVPVRAWTTTGGKLKSEEIGIRSLSVLVENGKLKIPRGNEESRRVTSIFVEELVNLGKAKHDDTVKAWWFAENAVRAYLKEAKVYKSPA